MTIIPYHAQYHRDTVALMAELQDHEHQLLPNIIPPGAEVAEQCLSHLLKQCEQHSGEVFLVIDDDSAIGFIGVYVDGEEAAHIYPEFKRFGYVSELVVAKPHRGQGISQKLMAAAENHCKHLGLNTIKVSALAINTATCDFYQGIGYQTDEILLSKRL